MSIKMGILIPSTNKNLDINKYNETLLYKIFLKSFIKTYDKTYKSKSIIYKIYIVVDKDDKIYSNNENIEKISSFVNLLKNVSIIFINNDNIEKGWVTKMWNKAFKRAYDEGCQYFYQCGDDIEFLDKGWVNSCLDQMKKHNDTGITGPIDWGREQFAANKNIKTKFLLTQTFVSRKHMDIFGFYFPEEIKNWYCDDWITYVYLSKNKFWKINKRILNKGGSPRYNPDGIGKDAIRMQKLTNNLINKYNKLL